MTLFLVVWLAPALIGFCPGALILGIMWGLLDPGEGRLLLAMLALACLLWPFTLVWFFWPSSPS